MKITNVVKSHQIKYELRMGTGKVWKPERPQSYHKHWNSYGLYYIYVICQVYDYKSSEASINIISMYREETGIWNFQTSFLWLKPNLVANINFNIAEMLASHMNEQCDLHLGLAYNLKTNLKSFCTSGISNYAQKVFFFFSMTCKTF